MKSVQKICVTPEVCEVMIASWAKSTQSSYNIYLSKWVDFCHKRKIDPYNCKFDNGIEFLSHLFQNGEKYGYIAAARSALSAVLQKEEDKTFGKDPRVTKFLK